MIVSKDAVEAVCNAHVTILPRGAILTILEAAAPTVRAEVLEDAAKDAEDPSSDDMDNYFIDQADVSGWLRARAVAERGEG